MSNLYDCIIIGGGPSGLAAAIYSARGKMKTILFEKGSFGGQISITDEIANYPGFYETTEEGRHPKNLINKMIEQAKEFGAEIEHKEVIDVNFNDKIKEIKTSDGNTYQAKAVIIATGAQPRKLGCKGELEYTGKGISYCATCDANFFEGMEVFCIGGGDTAVEEAMYLSKFARKATLDFMKWVVTSDEGTTMMAKEFGPIPFKNAKEPENVFFAQANELLAEGKYNVSWAFNYTPAVDDFRAGLVSALKQYAVDGNWEPVKTAFVDGWNNLLAQEAE